MIVVRLALPVRSPTPLVVPCTCSAPASTAASALATPQPASSCGWMPIRQRSLSSATTARVASATCGGSDEPLVSQSTTVSAPASAARAQAVQRVAGVGAPAVEEVLGVVDHALALRDQERDRRSDHVEVLLGRDLDDLLQVQAPGLADQRADRREAVGEHAQRRVLGRPAPAAARHPERGDLRVLEALAGEQVEELELLGVRGREAGLDQVDPELVELVGDAQLLGSAERHGRALHAIAQGRVVELDHATLAGTGTGSSHSR